MVSTATFTLPGRARDAEALFVDRTDRHLLRDRKRLAGGPVGIYRGSLGGWDADAAALPALERVGTSAPARPRSRRSPAPTSRRTARCSPSAPGSVRIFQRGDAPTSPTSSPASPTGPVPVEVQGEAVALTRTPTPTTSPGRRPVLSRWVPATPDRPAPGSGGYSKGAADLAEHLHHGAAGGVGASAPGCRSPVQRPVRRTSRSGGGGPSRRGRGPGRP